MRHTQFIAAAAVALLYPVAASAQIKFGTDLDAAFENAKKGKKMVLAHFTQPNSPGCAQMIKTVFSDPDIAEFAAKQFIAVRVSTEKEKGIKAFQTFGVKIVPSVLILDSDATILMQAENMTAAEFSQYLQKGVDLKAALEALAKVKNGSSSGMAAALARIGEIESVRSRKVLREHAENDKYSEAVRRTSLEGLSKQKNVYGDMVPFLGQKSQGLRTIAFNSLKNGGEAALPFLLDGLDGYTPEQRVNCFMLAAAQTMNPKISKDANFWRHAAAEDRDNALKAWKEWYKKNKADM